MAHPDHSQENEGKDTEKKTDTPLPIIRDADESMEGSAEDLDLELGDFEGDRRYGREDIADK